MARAHRAPGGFFFDFRGPTLPPGFVFSRASGGVDWSDGGVLRWSSENTVFQSENLDVAPWASQDGLQVTDNFDLNGIRMTTMQSGGSGSPPKRRQDLAMQWLDGQEVYAEITFQAGTSSSCQFLIQDLDALEHYVSWSFNVASGVPSTANIADFGSMTHRDPAITQIAGGHYRFGIYLKIINRSPANLRFRLQPTNSGGSTGQSSSFGGAMLQRLPNAAEGVYTRTLAAAYYGPRFTIEPNTATAIGLLRESQRTNGLLHSRDLTQTGTWAATNTNTARTAGADGVANSGSRITTTAASGQILQAVTLPSLQRASAAFVKRPDANTGQWFMTQNGGGTWLPIFPVQGAWTKYEIVETVANPKIGFLGAEAGEAIDVDMTQLEDGAFATSPIPTTAATVTRAEDFLTSDLAWLPQPVDGVFEFVGRAHKAVTGTDQYLYWMSDGTNDNRILVILRAGGDIRLDVYSGGIYVSQLTSPSGVADGVEFTVRVQIATDNFKLAVDSQPVQSDLAGAVPTGLNAMSFGVNQGGGNNASLNIKTFSYVPEGRLS